MQTELYFWKPLIDMLRKELSIIEEYYLKTKPQFENIENEAEEYANSLYENYPASEYMDIGDVAEWANEKGIERYEILAIMKKNHLLMTISMLYYIWEQQLIKFTIQFFPLYNH